MNNGEKRTESASIEMSFSLTTLVVIGKLGRKLPAAPPLPKLYEEPLVLVIGATAMVALLVFFIIIGPPSASVSAVCELSHNGRASDTSPRTYRSLSSGAKLTATASSFVPQLSSKVSGHVKLTESGGVCTIEYKVSGLTPGAHGFHLHTTSDFSNGCVSAGPIYNPFGKKHGGPTDRVRKVGDLGNVIADATGVAKGTMRSTLVKLSGSYSVIGRSIMVHADEDDLGKARRASNNSSNLEAQTRGPLIFFVRARVHRQGRQFAAWPSATEWILLPRDRKHWCADRVRRDQGRYRQNLSDHGAQMRPRTCEAPLAIAMRRPRASLGAGVVAKRNHARV